MRTTLMSEPAQFSIGVDLEKHGISAHATLNFEFFGDWSNIYDDLSNDEEEARHWFVQEVQKALEHYRNEARHSHTEPGTAPTEG
jgi:hypothetical protein